MTTLPIAHSWDDIKPGIESVVGTELTGWRTGPAITTGQVFPFDWSDIAKSYCVREVLGAHEFAMHTGEKVHPHCLCGINMCRTRDQALAYFHRMTEEGHTAIWAKNLRGVFYGFALCKVSIWPGLHVTGRPTHPELQSGLDPEWVARSNAMELQEIQLFDNVPTYEDAQFQKRNPGVPITRIEGNLRAAAKAAAGQHSPYVTGAPPVRFGMIGAAHIVLHQHGQVLLTRRSATVHDEAGKWGLPGGARSDAESYFRCALRETEEETGLIVAPAETTTRHKITTIEDTWRHITYVTDYAGTGTLGNDFAPDSDAAEWMPLDRISSLIEQGETTRDLAREWPEILHHLEGASE